MVHGGEVIYQRLNGRERAMQSAGPRVRWLAVSLKRRPTRAITNLRRTNAPNTLEWDSDLVCNIGAKLGTQEGEKPMPKPGRFARSHHKNFKAT